MQFPLTTTTARIDACNPCGSRRAQAMQRLGITEPSDEPITYAHLLDVLGLDDALWCCRAEPALAPLWRRYAVWCARQVQHLMTDPRSLAALDVAERHAAGQATDQQLAAAMDAAWVVAEERPTGDAWAAAWAAAWPAAWDAARDAGNALAAAWPAGADALAAALAAAWAAARDAAGDDMRKRQAAAFRQLVTSGTLPS